MKKVIPFSKEIPFQTKISEITDIEVTHNLEVTEENTIEGSFLVNGKYRMSDIGEVEEDFNYDLPFTIEVDGKYDLDDVKIRINDFYFEIINEDVLKVNVELELSEVKEREVVEEEEELLMRCYDDDSKTEVNDANIVDEKTEEDEVLEEDIFDKIPVVKEKKKEEIMETKRKQVIDSVQVIEPIDVLNKAIDQELNDTKPTQKNITAKSITDMFPTINNEEDTFKSYYVYIVRDNDTLDDIMTRYKTNKEEVSKYNNLDDIKIGSKIIIPCGLNE